MRSRLRLTYLLRSRTDGLEATSRFICEFNALAGAHNGAQLIQCMHTDNAPEIASDAFQHLLSKHGIKHQTSPAHIKEPNGIAERAIGTSRAIARSAMIAANAPLWTWGCAILHAEDVLNHCSGPSDKLTCKTDYISSHQLITGQQPNVMKIMPFGCLAIATRPPAVGPKITFGERGIRTFNLGRSREQPGTYRLWAPSEHKLIVTSDVVFYEEHFPWRLKLSPMEKHITAHQRNDSRTVLNLFSGQYKRPDGLTAAIQALGYTVVEVDNSVQHGGGHANDLLNDNFFSQLLEDCREGKFRAVFAAPPCSTFSVSRFFDYDGPDHSDRGPLPIRDRNNILGLPNLNDKQQTELRKANSIVSRCVAIMEAVAESGGSYICENPSDRGDPKQPVTYMPALKHHGPIWLMPEMIQLQSKFGGKQITFAQCEFGSPWQKYTTIAISPDLMATLGHLSKKCCSHTKGEHETLAGKHADGTWRSSSAAAYPPKLCLALAAALPPLKQQNNEPDDTSAQPQTEDAASEKPEPPTIEDEDKHNDNGENDTDQYTPMHNSGPRPDGGTFNFRNRNASGRVNFSLCAIVPNSIAGRALQAVASPPDIISPKGRKHALQQNREGWLAAEQKELDNHARNRSWTQVSAKDVPTGRRIIRMLWVYKVKRDGTLKARLCVMGNNQKPGVDFDQTYCATMIAASLRLLAAISASQGLSMWRIDFVSAYLQGELEDGEVVYCQMPNGYETTGIDGRPNVLRVEKPIYGLAQAGRRWQRSIFPWLKKFGLIQSDYDPCIFYIRKDNELLLIGCYVDDLLVCASHTQVGSTFRTFLAELKKDWDVEEEGEAVDLLNVHFTKTDSGILLHQRPYIESMVTKYIPDGVPLAFQRNWTPCTNDLPELIRRAMDSDEQPDKNLLKDYQSLVGALLYCATNTRPDIAYAVGMLCRAMSKPTPPLIKAAKRVLYYLARHADVGLHYEADPSDITAYSDADLGVQKSTTGWDIRWQRASISFGSKKQPNVATSSCHAEIIAASEAAKEAKFYREFADELGFKQTKPTEMYVDNTATVDLAYNPEFHNRTKHIDRRHFYVRELVEDHVIQVKYVNSSDNLADFFTKPLPAKSFFKLRDIIMNVH